MEDIEAMLCAYVEGDLDAAGRAQIEQHLANHPQHRKMIDELIAQRQLLRDLPRAAAPRDVDESVRGQMERSILLDDAAAPSFSRAAGRRRIPQLMTAAAVILLSLALGLIVYRVVVPTFKPAKFTPVASSQQLPSNQSDIETDIRQSQQQDFSQQMAPSGEANESAAAPAPQMQQAPLIAAVPTPVATTKHIINTEDLPIDLNRLRKTLKQGGYDLAPATDQQKPSMVMVINSPDAAVTGEILSKYLDSQPGVSWKDEGISSPTETVATYKITGSWLLPPSATTQPAQLATTQPATTQPMFEYRGGVFIAPSTQPSQMLQHIYVASGISREQADDLAKSISDQQIGVSTQTAEDSSLAPAATRPDLAGIALADKVPQLGAPTTQASADRDQLASPTTMPSQPEGGWQAPKAAMAIAGAGGEEPTSQDLVDAVIVVQSPPSIQLPTTRAAELPTTAPSTQPDRIAAPATTKPSN
jgi:putative zinc finger protein